MDCKRSENAVAPFAISHSTPGCLWRLPVSLHTSSNCNQFATKWWFSSDIGNWCWTKAMGTVYHWADTSLRFWLFSSSNLSDFCHRCTICRIRTVWPKLLGTVSISCQSHIHIRRRILKQFVLILCFWIAFYVQFDTTTKPTSTTASFKTYLHRFFSFYGGMLKTAEDFFISPYHGKIICRVEETTTNSNLTPEQNAEKA